MKYIFCDRAYKFKQPPGKFAAEGVCLAGQWHPAVRCGYIARAVYTRRRARRMAQAVLDA